MRRITEAEARAALNYVAGVKGQKPPPKAVFRGLIEGGLLAELRVGVAGMGRKLSLTSLGSLTRIAMGEVKCHVDAGNTVEIPAVGDAHGGRGNL